MSCNTNLIIQGLIIHCPRPFHLEIIENGSVCVKNNKIISIGKDINCSEKCYPKIQTLTLKKNQFLIPGLIDTHIHAPQYPNCGLGYDKSLLEWLQKYTFKLEARYTDVNFAKQVYNKIVRKTLDSGTTTASYFATSHVNSSLVLADIAIELGQRAFIGLVNMVRLAPDELIHASNDISIHETEAFLNAMKAKNSTLVLPIITPRFALSCNEDLLKRLGELAEKFDINIQSHICETLDEIDETLKLYKNTSSYGKVYDNGKLLTNKTVMAHSVYLSEEEMNLFAQKGTSVAHCPASNVWLQSGQCNVRKIIEKGIKVGLGTDVSGGASPSIIDAMRSSLSNSIHISFHDKNTKPLNYVEAFSLATLGGAAALALEDKVGNFQVGKEFDALVIDMGIENGPVDLIEDATPEELLQKFIYTADDRNVRKVFVAGKLVKDI